MSPSQQFDAALERSKPLLVLAPMQDVTDWAFWRLIHPYGGADLYVTEYFRVHGVSKLDAYILRSITDNPTGRPVLAQLIGNDIEALVRTARELHHYPVAGIDLNLGCPAPVVYRKCAGGGLLQDPDRVDAILGALREAVRVKFTVKTRIGFETADGFDRLLEVFAKHAIDLLTVHGRTVKEMYRSAVHYDLIRRAVERVPCPVLANGDIRSAVKAERVLAMTGARGLMIGRGAIRNPWLFGQIRRHGAAGQAVPAPRGRDVLDYVRRLYEAMSSTDVPEASQVQRLKKFMNFVGEGVDREGAFLHRIRRVTTRAEFFQVCEAFLDHEHPMTWDQEVPPGVETDPTPQG